MNHGRNLCLLAEDRFHVQIPAVKDPDPSAHLLRLFFRALSFDTLMLSTRAPRSIDAMESLIVTF